MHAWQELTPTAVSFIHKRGGTILGSSRGNRPDEHLDEIMVRAQGYECACMASLPMPRAVARSSVPTTDSHGMLPLMA